MGDDGANGSRSLLETLPVAAYGTDAEGRLTWFNRAASELCGRVPQLGTDRWCVTCHLYSPDGRVLPPDQHPLALALRGGEAPAGAEYIGERPDGTRFCFSAYPAVVRDPAGNVTGGLNVLIPRQDHTRPEQRERPDDANLLLSAIVDSSDDAIISKDLNGVITSWNQSAQRLFGYTAAEAVGQHVATLLIPEDRQGEEPEILARLRRGERVHHFETKRKRKDGTLLDISLTISPVKDSTGKVIGASKIARDVSDSKRLQAILVSSEARFRQLADAMPQIVWTARGDGHVDYYNRRWYEFTGFDREASADV